MSGNRGPRERLSFEAFELEEFQDGRCRAHLRLGWTRGRSFQGEAEGTVTQQGELRAAALAATRAVAAAVPELGLELTGVKAIRAFDAWVVIASLKATDEGGGVRRLLGALPAPGDETARGAALAVLNATNRLLGHRLPE